MQSVVTQIVLVPDGSPIFDERGYAVSVEDDSHGLRQVDFRGGGSAGNGQAKDGKWRQLIF